MADDGFVPGDLVAQWSGAWRLAVWPLPSSLRQLQAPDGLQLQPAGCGAEHEGIPGRNTP